MRPRRLGVTLMAGLALAACTSSTDTALADVQAACTEMGYEDGKSKESDSSDTTWTSDDWVNTADQYDDIANRVASAARDDGRWNRLSNALTDWQAATEKMVVVQDETLPQADRDAAQAEVDQLDVQSIYRVVSQECRKAQAD